MGPRAVDTAVTALVDFVFPPVCFACGGPLQRGEVRVCRACLASIRRVTTTDAHYLATRDAVCGDGLVDDLVAGFYFEKEGVLQSLIHELKYNGMRGLGRQLGAEIAPLIAGGCRTEEMAGIIPVPLHSARRRERGYNQAEEICRGIGMAFDLPVMGSLLERHRHTQSQTTLSVSERRENVEGAFRLRRRGDRNLAGCSYIVVDDVITTGATIRSCASVLKEHGANQVIACALALAL